MKRLIVAVMVAAALCVAAAASAGSTVEVAATLSLASNDGTTAVIHVEQTSGAPTTIYVYNGCNVYSATEKAVFTGSETKATLGSGDLSFYVGPRKFKGHLLTPNQCSAFAYLPLSGNKVLLLDYNLIYFF